MDIFEEIKEAVLSATPGEDTRNYYRNQGIASERERIIKLLEEMPIKAIKTEHGSQILSLELKDIIALIKGEQK